jgi:hypothetical protein
MRIPFDLAFSSGQDERLFRAETSILRGGAHFRAEFFTRECQIALNSPFSHA